MALDTAREQVRDGRITDADGRQVTVDAEARELKFAAISAAASGQNTLVAAVVGKRIRVLSYVLVATGAVTAQLRTGATTPLSGAMSLAANSGVSAVGGPNVPLAQTAAGEALTVNLGGAVQVSGHLTYVEV